MELVLGEKENRFGPLNPRKAGGKSHSARQNAGRAKQRGEARLEQLHAGAVVARRIAQKNRRAVWISYAACERKAVAGDALPVVRPVDGGRGGAAGWGGGAIVKEPHEVNGLVVIGLRIVTHGQGQIEEQKSEVNVGDRRRFNGLRLQTMLITRVPMRVRIEAITVMIPDGLPLMIVSYIPAGVPMMPARRHDAAKQHHCQKNQASRCVHTGFSHNLDHSLRWPTTST